MFTYILQRIAYLLVTLFFIVSITFILLQFMPGSPFNDAKLSSEQKAILNQKYGLADPLSVKYVRYLNNVLHGDLGTSFKYNNQSVSKMIQERIKPSALIAVQALVLGTVIGIILGAVAALKRNSAWDHLTTVLAVAGVSIPAFVIGSLMQYYLAVALRLVPVVYVDGDFLSTILPTISLAFLVIASTAIYMRTELIEVLKSDFVLLARAKGLSPLTIVVRHAMQNALIPVITILGPLTVGLISGSTVVERIFGVPGLGNLMVTSIQTNDYFVILGEGLVFSLIFLIIMLVVDILYGIIDPRIRLTGDSE